MSEYIKREDTLKVVSLISGDYATFSEIERLPAADVAPVVHGHWEVVEEMYGDIHWRCSVCGIEWCFIEGTPEENETNYCPNCGAKMDL